MKRYVITTSLYFRHEALFELIKAILDKTKIQSNQSSERKESFSPQIMENYNQNRDWYFQSGLRFFQKCRNIEATTSQVINNWTNGTRPPSSTPHPRPKQREV